MSTDARAAILDRIRQGKERAYLPSLTGATPPPPAPPPFDEPLTEVFSRAATAVQAQVHRAGGDAEAVALLVSELRARGCRQVLGWTAERLQLPGLGAALRAAEIDHIPSRLPGLRRLADLERLHPIPAGLTAAAAGLARTGSLAMFADRDHGRLASLLPPIHFALLRAEQIYPDLAAWLAADGVARQIAASSNTVIITGPSRTGDIAQTLTLGAHGPRELHIVLVGRVV
jgi:L-lactate dehydrogenase complex protein LldG